MIVVDNLSKSYGKQQLFRNISFKVNRRERVGVVGRNGNGKTTLFRLIAGLEEPDAGSIAIPRNYHIGYVQQELNFTKPTVIEEAALGLPHHDAEQTWRVEKILFGLGFGKDDLVRPPAELSGGFQVRLNLAKVLLDEHSLLLLDEPNNFLDITSIRWLARYLSSWAGELMLITHDRGFMDRVVTHILGIHRQGVRKLAGDTAKYYAQIAQDEETYEKTRINEERKRKEIENFINKFRASAQLTGLVESRKKTLAKWEKKEKLQVLTSLEFDFNAKPYHGKYVMTVEDLRFGYDKQKPLINGLNLTVGSRDRLFVVGPNGRGKTTLLKLMAGVLEPDAGGVDIPLNVSIGYYEQTNVRTLVDDRTVLEEVASAVPDGDPKRARFLCGTMMFEGGDALKKISVLSGGEKSRVLLAKILATPVNLLLLDEPTNHLDLESCEALLQALNDFEGAVVMVSHSEEFLNALAERLAVFQGGGVTIYEGGYGRFLEKVGWREEGEFPAAPARAAAPTAGPASAPPAEKVKLGSKELRRLRSQILAERAAACKQLEQRVQALEESLLREEAELDRMNRELAAASAARNGRKVVELSKAVHRTRAAMSKLYKELSPLLLTLEERRKAYDDRLAELEESTGQ
jgi:ATP-binding cassette subfamily F protein 3